MITGENPAISDYFVPGKEIVTYKNIPELLERIQYYLAHETEREAIREMGHKRSLREHTYQMRLARIFAECERGR